MNKEINKLIPELRFPEFVNDGEWVEKELGSILKSISNGLSIEQVNDKNGYKVTRIETISNKVIDLEKVGYVITELDISEYKLNIGDILLSNINSLSHIGKVVLIDKEYNLYHGMNLLRLVVKNTNNASFVFYQIDSNRIKKSIELRANKAVNQASINQSELKKTILFTPPKFKEQQKIADCFSSLEELIKKHTDKLETLKAYKKGLLQSLFPQEGEKVPKIRFKEFEKDGEWLAKTIEDIAKVTTGNKDTQNKVDDGKYPFFVRSQTVERINSFSYDGEAILTSGDGVGVGKNFHYINGKFDYHQRVYCIYNFDKEVSGKFVFMYFSQHFNERVMRMSAKNSVDSVRMAMITEMPISLPKKKEQEKIAEILSTLDNLIKEQTDKIEQLKSHKKGLMQGLFPKIRN